MKKIIRKIIDIYRDMDKPLFYLTLVFFIFGLLAIVSASSREAVVRYGATLYHYFFKQLTALLTGFVAFSIIIKIDTKRYNFFALLAYIVVQIGLIYLFFWGEGIKGAKNWIQIPGFGSIQPGEFAKPALVAMMAVIFDKYYKALRDSKHTKQRVKILALIILLVMIPVVLIFLERDLGTAMILVFIFGILFLASPILRLDKVKMIGFLVIGCAVALLGMYVTKGYILTDAQKSRLSFMDPCSRYETGGYQVCNGFIAINDGGLLGLGIGKSKQKYSYLSEPHTDSIFAIISEEMGLLRCSLIFIGYAVILLRILSISAKASTIRGRYLCLGVAAHLFAHIALNLGGILGVIPLTGVPLPFLSYGGSSVLSIMISLAFVQRVAIETRRKRITV